MKQIDKTNKIATSYHLWIDKLGSRKNPPYSASYRFYKDVLFNLLICQDGLCAYSEMRLIDKPELAESIKSFKKGRYRGDIKDLPADIEHFDSRLKPKYGWRWGNLFGVYNIINQKTKRREEEKLIKKGKSVHSIMKPDELLYNAPKLLKYNAKAHVFYPNNNKLNALEREQVEEMILCLGLNLGYVKMRRSEYFKELEMRIKLGENPTPHQFVTAWNMK